MDKNTIIGFLLIGVVLIVFTWLNQPTPEQIEAQRRMQDSIARIEYAKQWNPPLQSLHRRKRQTCSVNGQAVQNRANRPVRRPLLLLYSILSAVPLFWKTS